MLRKIYGIMESHASRASWPDYEEYLINQISGTLILETTKEGERKAYLYQEEELLGQRKEYRFCLEVPEVFPKRWFVNKYRLTRAYGGPEEGGWYWDCMEPLDSVQCSNQIAADALFTVMDAEIDHDEQENSDGHEVVAIENHPPIYPRRPRYA